MARPMQRDAKVQRAGPRRRHGLPRALRRRRWPRPADRPTSPRARPSAGPRRNRLGSTKRSIRAISESMSRAKPVQADRRVGACNWPARRLDVAPLYSGVSNDSDRPAGRTAARGARSSARASSKTLKSSCGRKRARSSVHSCLRRVAASGTGFRLRARH